MDLRDPTSAQRHPWERARFDAWVHVAAPYLRPGQRILDFGAGDGWFASQLQQRFAALQLQIDCVDAHAATAHPTGARTMLRAIPPSARYDIILLLDVLEHLDDDHAALRAIATEHAAPNATIFITVPAWPSLWSSHDDALLHQRRYTAATARALVHSANLRLLASGGWFYSLLPARFATVASERLRNAAAGEPVVGVSHAAWHHPAWLTRVVTALLRCDARVGTALRSQLPWPGLSWWGICQPLN